MITGIGTDIIEICRIQQAMEQGTLFLDKGFTEKERAYFVKKNHKAETVAGIFAAKEAVSKAIGTGFRTFGLKDIEIISNHLGKPEVIVYGGAKKILQELGVKGIHITISHCKAYAVAYAIIEGRESL